MPSSAARLKLLGLWERRILGMSRRTSGSNSAEHLLFAATGRAFALPSRDFHGSVAYDDGRPGGVGCLFAGR